MMLRAVRNVVLAVILVAPVAGCFVGSASSGTAALRVTNRTSQSICYVYISPTSSNSWGADQLGANTIPAGSSYELSIPAGNYDLKAEMCGTRQAVERRGVAVTSAQEWTISQ